MFQHLPQHTPETANDKRTKKGFLLYVSVYETFPIKNINPSKVCHYYQIQTQKQLQKPQLRMLFCLKPNSSPINDHLGWQFK